MRRGGCVYALLVGVWVSSALCAAPVPRTIIALYDKDRTPDTQTTQIHQFAEMPLNHLGYVLEYHDCETDLPDITHRDDVVGVITWFGKHTVPDDPHAYFNWAYGVAEAGKKFVIMDYTGFDERKDVGGPSTTLKNRFWAHLGLRDESNWVSRTYATEISAADLAVIEMERSYEGLEEGYPQMSRISHDNTPHLAMRLPGEKRKTAVVVSTSDGGGYATLGYGLYKVWSEDFELRKWYINPFEFFRHAFGDLELPKADTTTLNGRRIYFSHIDGDGWISNTQIKKYQEDKVLCADVIYRDVLKAFPDLPCSVGPIAADINVEWVGTKQSREVARKIFLLPNVETANHTLSHPLDWAFFEHYKPEYEEPYLGRYQYGAWGRPAWDRKLSNYFHVAFGEKSATNSSYSGVKLEGKYEIPRAYANKVFDLSSEVKGAVENVSALAPSDKPVAVYLWSGNCQPYEAAVALTREVGIPNLNGGDTRFDVEYNSYAWVRPVGRAVGTQRQIYACNSNENTYTDLWLGRYYGFNRLPETFKNTETPVRVKGMNLYYHMYSGELVASLNALLHNIAYVEGQQIIPIEASRFAKIGDGFYSTQFDKQGDSVWMVRDRGELQTIRFDRSTFRAVDFTRSDGVLGQRHHQGSLYVALDSSVDTPVIALRDCAECTVEPKDSHLYLVQSRWRIWNVERLSPTHVRFNTAGFGAGEMGWHVPKAGRYRVSVIDTTGKQHSEEREVLGDTLQIIAGRGAEILPFTVEVEAIP